MWSGSNIILGFSLGVDRILYLEIYCLGRSLPWVGSESVDVDKLSVSCASQVGPSLENGWPNHVHQSRFVSRTNQEFVCNRRLQETCSEPCRIKLGNCDDDV